MPIADIGPWEFLVPEGWQLKDQGIGVSYLESPDRTTGMYVKTIELTEPMDTSRQVAAYVQDAHCSCFQKTEGNDWKVVDQRDEQDGTLFRSALELFDETANYRLLSLVVADRQTAVQITFHDYLCEDYDVARGQSLGIESSIAKVAGAA